MTYNPYMNQLNPYQQLDALRQQAAGIQQQYLPQQQYQQPYAQPVQQQQQQIPNIQLLIQQEIQRQLSMAPQQQALMPPAQPQVPPGIAIMQAVGNQMTVGDQQWLSANLNGLPGFFNTTDGRELVALAISGYKRHMGVLDE